MKKVYTNLFLFGTLSSAGAQWTESVPMLETRTQHMAVVLNSGKVLMAGGYDGTIHLSSAEVYDPVADEWSATSNYMSSYHSTAAIVKLASGKALVTGGYNGSMNIAVCELYDPATDTWNSGGSMLTGRSYHTATLLNDGRVLVTGGYTGSENTSSCEVYNPASNTWSATDSLATGRSYHRATLLNDGRVLVTGGYNPDEGFQLATAEIFDPVTNTWSAAPDMNDARAWHAASLLPDGKVLVTGGEYFTGGSPYAYEGLKTAEIYDPTVNNWSNATDMSGGLCYHQQFTLSGKVLVVAGQANTDYGTNFLCVPGVSYLYNISTNTWASVPMNLDGRLEFGAVKMNDGRVLVAGGHDNSVEIFDQFLSVDEESGTIAQLQVYPNPAKGIFEVRATGNEKILSAEVSGLDGRQVYARENIQASGLQVDLGGASEGIYLVRIKTDAGTALKKITLIK